MFEAVSVSAVVVVVVVVVVGTTLSHATGPRPTRCTGRPPSLRAAAALAVVGDSAFIFGKRGRRGRMDDLQDLWLLETESLDWEEVELAYDHGEVRCLPDLDDHCDGVMHLQLGQARP